MKYFSLLSGDLVQTTSGKKIIPQKEMEKALSGIQLLNQVKKDAKKYREEVAKECEMIKEQSAKEGFQEGLEKINKHILSLHSLLQEAKEEVHEKILPLAIQAAKKILGEELKLHKERIVDIVMQALKPVTQHRRVTIYVNKKDLDILEEKKDRIKEILDQVDSFSIQEREDVEPGGCIIETEAGIINAQLENQWRALENAFRSFMKKK